MTFEYEWAIPTDRRARRIEEVCELVIRIMQLRPPQGEALRRISKALQRLPKPLHECSEEERQSFLTLGGVWQHTAHPNFTISLATGVGKTRLVGAVIALLYLTKESKTFLILAPRRAVLRRFADALDPNFREYIFIENGWIPEPYVVTGDQISQPAGVEATQDMFRRGPTIYLLSPQLISSSDRFREPQAFTGRAPADHLRSKSDLVVLVDEAHHIGGLAKRDAARWTESIRALKPTVQFGMTATPRNEEGENILYNYPLAQALLERLYTKDVRLLVRNFDSSPLSDSDIDCATISYALDRLKIKETASRLSSTPPFPDVKPVCVFFGRDIAHAEWIASVLEETHGLSSDEILVTHSRSSKREEEVERLLSIEDISNPVRFVVNVQELTEGWDVRNVYVVAPLRAMATFQGALQAMGRGLRLPAGSRTGDPDLDALDVVCFGKQSLKAIVEEATTWLGQDASSGGSGFSAQDYSAGALLSLPIYIPERKSISINITELETTHEEVSLKIAPAVIKSSALMTVEELDIARLRSKLAKENPVHISRTAFVQAATLRALRVASRYISDDIHFAAISEIVESWLQATKIESEMIEFDPVEVGELIGRIIADGARKRTLDYHSTGVEHTLHFKGFDVSVVVSLQLGEEPPASSIELLPLPSRSNFTPRTVIRGLDGHEWTLSLHGAYSFDSLPEAELAWTLDHSEGVTWWVRNEPKRLRIPTPAGYFSPDFLVCTNDKKIHIVEVKGSNYWEPPESEARIKAAAASRWTVKQNSTSAIIWSFGVALESDVASAGSFDVLLNRLRN